MDPRAGAWLARHPKAVELAYYADLFRRLSGERPEPCHAYREPIRRLLKESRACPGWLSFRGAMLDLGADAAGMLVRFLSPAARRRLLADHFADVGRYLFDPVFAGEVRQRLYRLLVPALRENQRILLMAHSLGSVVAYDSLWELSGGSRFNTLRDRSVDLFVTLGSPLGDETVKENLLGGKNPPATRYPRNIRRWVNLAARGDTICYDARMANDFRPMRRMKLLESFQEQTDLCSVYRGRDGAWNPHKLYGYLILPEVGRLVANFLSMPA